VRKIVAILLIGCLLANTAQCSVPGAQTSVHCARRTADVLGDQALAAVACWPHLFHPFLNPPAVSHLLAATHQPVLTARIPLAAESDRPENIPRGPFISFKKSGARPLDNDLADAILDQVLNRQDEDHLHPIMYDDRSGHPYPLDESNILETLHVIQDRKFAVEVIYAPGNHKQNIVTRIAIFAPHPGNTDKNSDDSEFAGLDELRLRVGIALDEGNRGEAHKLALRLLERYDEILAAPPQDIEKLQTITQHRRETASMAREIERAALSPLRKDLKKRGVHLSDPVLKSLAAYVWEPDLSVDWIASVDEKDRKWVAVTAIVGRLSLAEGLPYQRLIFWVSGLLLGTGFSPDGADRWAFYWRDKEIQNERSKSNEAAIDPDNAESLIPLDRAKEILSSAEKQFETFRVFMIESAKLVTPPRAGKNNPALGPLSFKTPYGTEVIAGHRYLFRDPWDHRQKVLVPIGWDPEMPADWLGSRGVIVQFQGEGEKWLYWEPILRQRLARKLGPEEYLDISVSQNHTRSHATKSNPKPMARNDMNVNAAVMMGVPRPWAVDYTERQLARTQEYAARIEDWLSWAFNSVDRLILLSPDENQAFHQEIDKIRGKLKYYTIVNFINSKPDDQEDRYLLAPLKKMFGAIEQSFQETLRPAYGPESEQNSLAKLIRFKADLSAVWNLLSTIAPVQVGPSAKEDRRVADAA
jgi:hypothetical protein